MVLLGLPLQALSLNFGQPFAHCVVQIFVKANHSCNLFLPSVISKVIFFRTLLGVIRGGFNISVLSKPVAPSNLRSCFSKHFSDRLSNLLLSLSQFDSPAFLGKTSKMCSVVPRMVGLVKMSSPILSFALIQFFLLLRFIRSRSRSPPLLWSLFNLKVDNLLKGTARWWSSNTPSGRKAPLETRAQGELEPRETLVDQIACL